MLLPCLSLLLLPVQIWLDDVQCTGSEESIFLCPHSPWGEHNCVHAEDASAVCTSKLAVWLVR